jgi:hypothetical protein
MRAIQHNNAFGDRFPSYTDRLKYHKDVRSHTLVVDLEAYSFWKDLITQTEFSKIFEIEFDLKIGMSIVHPADQFNRKEGLKMALSNMKTERVKLSNIEIQSSGDIELSFDIHGTALRILMGVSGNRAIITRKYTYSALKLFADIFGR